MEKIKVAADTCIIIMLARLDNQKNMDAKDRAVLDCLKNKILKPSLYEDTPYRFLPSLLQDKLLGNIEIGTDGNKYYSNLLDIYQLYKAVKSGRCQLYITPTVFGEIDFDWYKDQRDFVEKYVNIVQIAKEDECEFYSKRGMLARKYVERGAMLEKYSAPQRKKVPQNDAYIMAEASLCGLVFVTTNDKDFINYKNKNRDYTRTNIIEQVNNEEGLVFETNIPRYMSEPHPISLRSLVLKARAYGCTDRTVKPFFIPHPLLDEENVYTALK